MVECIMNAIGRKQSLSKKSLSFVIKCNYQGSIWYSEITIEDFFSIFKSISKSLLLLPYFNYSKLESYDPDYLDTLQENLSEFLYKIRYREDIISHHEVQELFSIPQIQPPIEYMSSSKVSDYFTLTYFIIVPGLKSIIACSEYISMFKGIGKLWSLIETQNLGEVSVLGFGEELFRINNSEIQEQAKCCYWKQETFEIIVGLESGNIVVIKCKMKLGPNSKGVFDGDKLHISDKKVHKIHSSRVLSIKSLDHLILSISSDNILKISTCN